MLDGLMNKGVLPFVVLPDRNGIYKELTDRNVPVFVCIFRSQAYPHHKTLKEWLLFLPRLIARLYFNYRAAKKIYIYATAKQIDLIHTNVGVAGVGFHASRRAGIPHIYHIREYADLIGTHYFPTKDHFLRQLDLPGSFSICITKDLQRYYKQEEKPTSIVIYDGVKETAESFRCPEQRSYLLYVGRIESIKGLDVLVRAYHAYTQRVEKEKVLPLKIAGQAPPTSERYLYHIQQYVHCHQIADKVCFLGHRSDIDQLMNSARAIIIPSLYEGFGFCLSEAMFQGCLAIANDTNGTKEQLDNGLALTDHEIALRYHNTKCIKICAKIEEELTDLLIDVTVQSEESFDDYRRYAFQAVNTLYTKERHVEDVFEFYKTINSQNLHPICQK